MTYSKYGLTFRKIREQKQFSLAIFPQIGISKPSLSKFERGETMMGFESVVRALQEMGVTLEEYENFLNAYSMGEEESLWEEVEQAVYQEDMQRLQDIHCYARESNFYFLSLAVRSCLRQLDMHEAEEVTDCLYAVEMWGFSELRLFYFSMPHLSFRDISHILDSFFPKGHELFNSEKHRQIFVQVCCRAIVLFSTQGQKTAAQILLKQMETHNLARTMFQKNLKNITEGYWLFCCKNKPEGKKYVIEGLEILGRISSPEELSYYKKRYFLKK